MNRYMKLVQMEVHRFRYMLGSLLAMTLLVQMGGMVWTVLNELARREEAMLRGETISNGSAFFPGGNLSFAWAVFSTHIWFYIPILASIVVLMLYVLVIWYRDWFGRDTFIYRLLTLPGSRRTVYWAKLSAMLLFVFSMVSFQVLLLLAEQMVFDLIVPAEFRDASYFSDAISANEALVVLLPHRIADFLLSYGLGTVGVILLFTAVIIERSYRGIGILYAIGYVAVCVAAVLFPMVGLGINNPRAILYPDEIFMIELGVCVVVVILSIWLGIRLLNRKITV